MNDIGDMIRNLRKEKGESLETLARLLSIDSTEMIKIEKNHQKLSREQVEKLVEHYNADKNEMLFAWLNVQCIETVEDGMLPPDLAEQKVAYPSLKTKNNASLFKRIHSFFNQDGRVQKAWVFGSFARGEDKLQSDIDILIQERTDVKFSYFDLADIQYHLEVLVKRKVDLGFANAIKPHAEPHILKEAILIYEKS